MMPLTLPSLIAIATRITNTLNSRSFTTTTSKQLNTPLKKSTWKSKLNLMVPCYLGKLAHDSGHSLKDIIAALSNVTVTSTASSVSSVSSPSVSSSSVSMAWKSLPIKDAMSVLSKLNVQYESIPMGIQTRQSIIQSSQSSLMPRTEQSQWMMRPPIVTIMGHVDHGKTTLLDTIRQSQVAANEHGGITQHIGAFLVDLSNNPDSINQTSSTQSNDHQSSFDSNTRNDPSNTKNHFNQSSSSVGHQKICFLDTPGHEAFSAMRQRGAQVTDIVILVVAADDGIQPQTIEALQHARHAGTPIIVAINKCDRHANRSQLVADALWQQHNLQLEEHGGDVQAVRLSALTGQGVPQLLQAILAQADMLDLAAHADGPVEAMVIEGKFIQGMGEVTSVIVQHGILRPGAILLAYAETTQKDDSHQKRMNERELTDLGEPVKRMNHELSNDLCGPVAAICRVRGMRDSQGRNVKEALPGWPVEISGWKDVADLSEQLNAAIGSGSLGHQLTGRPPVGARLIQVDSEEQAIQLLSAQLHSSSQGNGIGNNIGVNSSLSSSLQSEQQHQQLLQQVRQASRDGTLMGRNRFDRPDPGQSFSPDGTVIPTYRMLLCVDVEGSLEALSKLLKSVPQDRVRLDVLATGIGQCRDGLLELAASSGADIHTFNLNTSIRGNRLEELASRKKIRLFSHRIIYALVEEVKNRMSELLPPVFEQEVLATATVQQVFQVDVDKKACLVAGCRILQGTFVRITQEEANAANKSFSATKTNESSAAKGKSSSSTANGQESVVAKRFVRVQRRAGQQTVYRGWVKELRHLKKEVPSVQKGMECGILLDGIEDLQVGDTIEIVKSIPIKQVL